MARGPLARLQRVDQLRVRQQIPRLLAYDDAAQSVACLQQPVEPARPNRPCPGNSRSIHELTAAVYTRFNVGSWNTGPDVSNTMIGAIGSNVIVDSLSNMPLIVPSSTMGENTRAASLAFSRARSR